MCGAGEIWELYTFCEPKIALQNKDYLQIKATGTEYGNNKRLIPLSPLQIIFLNS